ncbi:hypothetical protein, partial [Chroococcidiopsis sp. FACHB-1243]|uniref:hypothetical protein n=1 Tax=Chroococcidiopsis sp. [FACHB-1243] TaxID=2692781 RepID=UPI001A7E5B08
SLDGEDREMLTDSLFTEKYQKLYEDLSQDSTFLGESFICIGLMQVVSQGFIDGTNEGEK